MAIVDTLLLVLYASIAMHAGTILLHAKALRWILLPQDQRLLAYHLRFLWYAGLPHRRRLLSLRRFSQSSTHLLRMS
jgi:hypothetical protein